MGTAHPADPFRLGEDHLTPEHLEVWVDTPGARLSLGEDARARMAASYRGLEATIRRGDRVYGVNTGFGGNARPSPRGAGQDKPPEDGAAGLQRRLALYLDAGSGPPLAPRVVRAILMARAHVLAQGRSAVPPRVVDALSALFHDGPTPELPAWGSLGASGDLITLAPLARLLLADDEAPSRTALALMNGLSGVTAQVALDLVTALRLVHWGIAGSAVAAWALGVRQEAWDAVLHAPPIRHHSGQTRIASLLRERVAGAPSVPLPAGLAIQDPYSLRCIPQLLGPGLEQLDLAHRWISQELESVSDNPIWVDADTFLSSGHFFGGYVVQAADTVAGVLARMGDLLERQTFLLVDGTRGLPPNLSGAGFGPEALRHGLKGVHQAASALAMRLQRGAIPSAPFARSAEGHNQDIVSNAMNAATVLTEQVDGLAALVAAHSTLAAQALEFRDGWQDTPGVVAWHGAIRRQMPPLWDDAPLREPLAHLARDLRAIPVPGP